MKPVYLICAWIIVFAPVAWAQPAPNSTDAPSIEQVIVTAPKLSAAIKSFVQSYATPSLSAPVIARWKNGICPSYFWVLAAKGQ